MSWSDDDDTRTHNQNKENVAVPMKNTRQRWPAIPTPVENDGISALQSNRSETYFRLASTLHSLPHPSPTNSNNAFNWQFNVFITQWRH